MRKITFALMLILAFVSCACANYTPSYEGSGSGTDSGDALWVVTATDLARLRNSVNDGEESPGRYYILSQDIHITNTQWKTIGNMYMNRAFSGHFDGNGKTIHVQIQELPDDDSSLMVMDRALFGFISTDKATEESGDYAVRNLKVSGFVEGYDAAGIVSVLGAGIIEGCSVSADLAVYERGTEDYTMLPKINAGGIVAVVMGGTIRNCDFCGSIYAESQKFHSTVAGGIAASITNVKGKIEGCTVKSYSTITAKSMLSTDNSIDKYNYHSAGGIVGLVSLNRLSAEYDTVTGCVFEGGEITSSHYAGGITGIALGGTYTYNTVGEDTRISAKYTAGGIAATLSNGGYVFSNDIQGGIVSADGDAVGGIVGAVISGDVQSNDSYVAVRGNAKYKGGVIGQIIAISKSLIGNRYRGADYGIGIDQNRNTNVDTGSTKISGSGLYFVTPATLPSATEGKNYSYTIELNQAATVNLTPIPSWMSPTMNATNTAITLNGIPTATGETSFTLSANSGSYTASRTFTINVAQQLYIDGLNSISAFEGEYVSISPDVKALSYDISGVSFTWSASGIPSGLSMDSEGKISGIIETAGEYSLKLRAIPNNGLTTATATIKIYVLPEFEIVDSSLPDGKVTRQYTHTIATNLDSSMALAWSISSGSLPDGLSLESNTGRIIGTPTTEGDYTFTVSAVGNVSTQKTFTLTINPAIVITTDSNELPYAFTGEFYSYELSNDVKSGNSVTWEISSTLPAGLTFNDGLISGLVSDDNSVVGDYTFNVKITSDEYTNSKALTLKAVCFKFEPDDLPGAVYGTKYSHDMTQYLTILGVSEDLITWSADENALPAGLTLSESGDISGVPTVSGDFAFAVRVVLSGDYVIEDTCNLKVYSSVSVVESADFESIIQNGAEVSSCAFTLSPDVLSVKWSVSGDFPGGLTLDADTGIISGTPTQAGVYDFTVQAKAGDFTVSKDFTLDVRDFFISSISQPPEISTGQLYSFKFTAQGLSDDLIIWSADNDALPEGLTFYNAGLIVGTTQAEGTYTFTVQAISGKFTASQDVTLTVSTPIAIKTDSILPNAAKGVRYSLALSNDIPSGRAQSWQVVRGTLPAGLTLGAENGVISGIPDMAGIFTFTVQVMAGKTTSRDFTLSVLGITSSPDIVLPDAKQGEHYSYQLSANIVAGDSESLIWAAIDELPAGLTLNASGLLSGTPIQAGTTAFSVRAFVNSNVSSDLVLTLTVNPGSKGGAESEDNTVSIITSSLPLAEIGKEYSATLESNPSGTTWTLADDSLPDGLILSADGKITGIPTQIGSYVFTVKASYTSYIDGEKQLIISVFQSGSSSEDHSGTSSEDQSGSPSGSVSGSGGGCDSGMGTTALILSFIAAIINTKRKH